MKFELNKKTLQKIAFVLILLMIAPFAMEIVFIADIVGAEAAVLFLFYFLKDSILMWVYKWERFKRQCTEFIYSLSSLIMFQPRNYFMHASASSLIIIVTGSLVLACYLWVPVILVSSGYFI